MLSTLAANVLLIWMLKPSYAWPWETETCQVSTICGVVQSQSFEGDSLHLKFLELLIVTFGAEHQHDRDLINLVLGDVLEEMKEGCRSYHSCTTGWEGTQSVLSAVELGGMGLAWVVPVTAPFVAAAAAGNSLLSSHKVYNCIKKGNAKSAAWAATDGVLSAFAGLGGFVKHVKNLKWGELMKMARKAKAAGDTFKHGKTVGALIKSRHHLKKVMKIVNILKATSLGGKSLNDGISYFQFFRCVMKTPAFQSGFRAIGYDPEVSIRLFDWR